MMQTVATVAAAAVSATVLTTGFTDSDAEVTYSIHQRGAVQSDLDTFAREVSSTLRDPRGWSLGGRIEFREVPSDGEMRVVLASPDVVETASPGCDWSWSCRVGQQVLINDLRWRKATESWTESARAYRHYVINHEVGHYLGLEHVSCPATGRPARVMQQQSISLEGCRVTVWPLLPELREAADHQGLNLPREWRPPKRAGDAERTQGHTRNTDRAGAATSLRDAAGTASSRDAAGTASMGVLQRLLRLLAELFG